MVMCESKKRIWEFVELFRWNDIPLPGSISVD